MREILELVESGLSIRSMCKELGTSYGALRYRLKKLGISTASSRKPKPKSECRMCGGPPKKGGRYCSQCYTARFVSKYDVRLPISSFVGPGGSNRFTKIRTHARFVANAKGGSCEIHGCGYSKHVEVSHVKAISSFDLNTPLSVVNDPSNLKLLCPNHHWEFDHANK
jgi:hypothetical protein